MTPENFCYWLRGRTELKPGEVPTAEEWAVIEEHLELVFGKVTAKEVKKSKDELKKKDATESGKNLDFQKVLDDFRKNMEKEEEANPIPQWTYPFQPGPYQPYKPGLEPFMPRPSEPFDPKYTVIC